MPNVCFPCATLQDADTGRIALYYGCADSYVGLAFTTVDEVVDYIKTHDNPPITRWASAKRQAQPSLSMLRIAISAKKRFYVPYRALARRKP